jgi:hypothetical protein
VLSKFEPVDYIVLVLATTICLLFIGGVVDWLLYPDKADAADNWKELGLAVLGVIAVYVGSRLNKHFRGDKQAEKSKEP